MKILFDNQVFGSQKYGGISRYFVEIFRALDNSGEISYQFPTTWSNNEYLEQEKFLINHNLWQDFLNRKLHRCNFKYKNLIWLSYKILYRCLNIYSSKKMLKKQNFDIFHPTYYNPYFLKYIKNKRFVLTVYDMIHELYPQYFSVNDKTARRKKALIFRADKIIAISENTKQDIINLYNISEDKIEVIYLANSLKPIIDRPINFSDLPKRYILYVGSRNIYKNFIFFIKSIAPLLVNDRGLCIIVAGGYSIKNQFSQDETSLFKELNIERQILQYSISDKILVYLYQNATCFVFPTLYEGFGIPVLEAFACNCPAVISSTSSLPEIGGTAVEYFDPLSSASIIYSVKRVVYDQNLRKDMIVKGREKLKEFSWEKTLERMKELYSNLL